MTANTTQRVDVQRPDTWSRNEIILGACPPGPFITLAQHGVIIAALLQQMAELREQHARMVAEAAESYSRATAAESKLAEQAAEIERLRGKLAEGGIP